MEIEKLSTVDTHSHIVNIPKMLFNATLHEGHGHVDFFIYVNKGRTELWLIHF